MATGAGTGADTAAALSTLVRRRLLAVQRCLNFKRNLHPKSLKLFTRNKFDP